MLNKDSHLFGVLYGFWLTDEAIISMHNSFNCNPLHPFTGTVDSKNTNGPLKTRETMTQLRINHGVTSPSIVVTENHLFV